MFFAEKKYYKKNLKLATPIIIANLGQATVGIIDNVMVGHLGAIELAAASLATIIFHNILIFGTGIAVGLTPLAGELFATGSYKKAGELFQNSLILNIIVGSIITLLLFSASPLISKMGQPLEVVSPAIEYFKIISISLLPLMVFLSFKQFMEGLGNTRVSMTITIISNVLNIVLNYLLIYGKMGMPEMGVNGAAIATLISRLFMPIAFFVYLRSNNSLRRYFSFFSRMNTRIRDQKMLLKIGLPISGQMTVEVFALSMTAIFMGWISAESLAANQIALSVCTAMFMVVLGISGAVTIVVSHASGQGDIHAVREYTKAGLQMSIGFMSVAALMFVLFGRYIAMLYTTNLEVIDIATKVFLVIALFEISDGIQVTALGALRGLQEVRMPMIIAFISYFCVNIPVAYLLGFVFGFGEMGIWFGFFIGLTVASVMLLLRFRKLTLSN